MHAVNQNINIPFRIIPKVQNYHWGQRGRLSVISKLIKTFNPEEPLAELWVGAHPKASSIAEINAEKIPLNLLILENPETLLGEKISREYNNSLPFLFKILSINRALSIQTHPDLETAKNLHAKDPLNYPDSNHKPELAIALTDVKLLYGFKEHAELLKTIKNNPELKSLISENSLSLLNSGKNPAQAVKEIYSDIVNSDISLRSKEMSKLYERLLNKSSSEFDEYLLQFFNDYGSGDIGIPSSMLMNFCTLRRGDGIFIGANIPHAYLYGELAECMANSDNVVRAGLTPKFQDVETLLQILDYSANKPAIIRPTATNNSIEYKTPTKEFQVSALEGPHQSQDFLGGDPTLLFLLEGDAKINASLKLKSGDAIFIPANVKAYSLELSEGAKIFSVKPST